MLRIVVNLITHHSKLISTGLFPKIRIDKQICCQEKPKLDDYIHNDSRFDVTTEFKSKGNHFFSKLSIKKKLLLLISLINICSLLAMTTIYIAYSGEVLRREAVQWLGATAQIIGHNCTASLLFDDASDAQQVIDSVKFCRSIVAAGIFDDDGLPLAVYTKSGRIDTSFFDSRYSNTHFFTSNGLFYYHTVMLNGEKIGTVAILDSLSLLKTMQRQKMTVAVAVLIVIIIVGVIAAISFEHIITDSILTLARMAQKVKHDKDYSLRGKINRMDEIGHLTEAFNDMLGWIENQNDQLRKAQYKAENTARNLARANESLSQEIRQRIFAETQLKDYQKHLENMVQEQTAELQDINRKLVNEIAENKATAKMIKASLKEKTLLLGEVHHRVKNNLQIIYSLMSLAIHHSKSEPANIELSAARSKIFAIALIHEQLCQSNQFGRLNMRQHIQILFDSIAVLYSDKRQQKIELQLDCININLSIDQAVPLTLILNELISNVFKHAYPENETGICHISISVSNDGQRMNFRLSDDGRGIPKSMDIDKIQSLGFRLIRNLALTQLKGDLKINSSQGTKIYLTFELVADDKLIHHKQLHQVSS